MKHWSGILRTVLAMGATIMSSDVTGANEICLEAEDFHIKSGWRVAANTEGYFPSMPHLWSGNRLLADESDARAVAEKMITIENAGTYNAWVHCESSWNFDALFKIEIEQNEQIQQSETLGRKEQVKLFPYRMGWRVQGPWRWHNTDWVYQKATFNLSEGPATIRIIKETNGYPRACRVIDFVYLTDDLDLQPGGPNTWGKKHDPAVLGTFKTPLYFKAKVSPEADTGVEIEMHSCFWLYGRWGGPQSKYYFSVDGVSTEKADRDRLLKAGQESSWQAIEFAKVLPVVLVCRSNELVELSISQLPTGEDAATFTLGPEPKELIAATGNQRWENFLGGKPAISLAAYLDDLTSMLEAYVPEGRRAKQFGMLSAFPGWMSANPEVAIGDFDTRRLAAACGLNGQHYNCDPEVYGPEGEGFGFNRAPGYLGLWNRQFTRECHEGDFTGLRASYEKSYHNLKEKRLGNLRQDIKIIEECGAKSLQTLRSWPKVNATFRDYLKSRSITPGQVLDRDTLEQLTSTEQSPKEDELWAMVTLGKGTPEEAVANPVLYYHSTYFRALLHADVCREATRMLEDIFPEGTLTNSGSFFPTVGCLTSLIMGDDPFLIFQRRGVTSYCSETSWGQGGMPGYVGPETESYGAAVARGFSKYYDCPRGGYIICDGNRGYTPDVVETMSLALAAQGHSSLIYYTIGYPSINNVYAYPDIFKAIKRVSFTLGQVEDTLLDCNVANSKAALGWSLTTDIWDVAEEDPVYYGPGDVMYAGERQYLYLLLRHLGMPVDILAENDLETDYLEHYDVYFLVGDHLTEKAAAALKQWVADGGTLVSVTGGGLKNEYNQPMDTLNEVFGITEATLAKETTSMRAKLELVHAQPLDYVDIEGISETLPVFGYTQTFVPDKGEVVGRFRYTRKPAAVMNSYGKGKAMIVGALPGTAHLSGAFPMKPYGRGGEDLSSFVHPNYNRQVETAFDALLAKLGLSAQSLSPIRCLTRGVEANLLKNESTDSYCVTLVNFTNEPLEEVELRIDGNALGGVRTVNATFASAHCDNGDGTLNVSLPLEKFELLKLNN
ncbi:MAG: beta-galactosidase trimerization domain-containing protein [Candidatus Pacebacteria bacterium]|nr:beta-galactosidase trimerization domain-containing protein [Candidatus Paceibacterota bacterium]